MNTHLFPSWDKNAHWVRVYRARIRLGLEKCRLCGCVSEWGTERQLTLDHIWPRSKGGTSQMENATILCARCNNAKGDSLAVYRVSLAEEESRVRRRERWSTRSVPEVPPGPWDQPQPPRSRKAIRRALEQALPEWARPYYADFPPGQIPPHVMKILVEHHGEEDRVPAHVRRIVESG